VVALVGAELKPTLQLVDTPGVRLAAVHDKEDTVETTAPVIVPPLPVRVTLLPVAEAPPVPLTPMEVDVAVVGTVTLTVATTPLGMIVLLRPDARHV
jgi:hypothetical protein